MQGNPDASLFFAAPGSGEPDRRACGGHDGLIDSAVRPPVARCAGRPKRILARSKCCRGRNRSRRRPERGNLRRDRSARLHQPVGRPHTDVDEPPRGWNTAPACVPRHDVGRGAGTNLQVRIGAAPVFRTAVSASSSALDVAAPRERLRLNWLEPMNDHHSAADGYSGSRLERPAMAA
jgi:hypothetical protein